MEQFENIYTVMSTKKILSNNQYFNRQQQVVKVLAGTQFRAAI